MKIISLVNAKGGVGKSTITFNLAGTIAANGKSTLVIDNDCQGNVTSAFNVNVKGKYTMYDVYTDKKIGFDDAIINVEQNIDIIPNNIISTELEDELARQGMRDAILQRKLSSLPSKYDYVLIDNNPYVGTQTKNSFAISDYYLGVIDTSIDALIGLNIIEKKVKNDVLETYLNSKIKNLGVIWNMYDMRTNFGKEISEYLTTNLQGKMFNTKIKDTVRIKEARGLNKTIDKINKELKEDFNSLYNEIETKIKSNL